MGGANDDHGQRLAVDKAGDVYLLGTFQGQAEFGAFNTGGLGSSCIAKLDAEGNVKWLNTFGGPIGIQSRHIAASPDGAVYVAGTMMVQATFGTNVLFAPGDGPPRITAEDAFLAKYSTEGTLLWARNYGGDAPQRCWDMCVNATGDVFMAGNYLTTATFGHSNLVQRGIENLWFTKLSSQGDVIWARGAGAGIWLNSPPLLATDPSGNAFVSCGFARWIELPTGDTCIVTNQVWSTNEVLVRHTEFFTNVICYTNSEVVPPSILCTNNFVQTNYYTPSNYVTFSLVVTQQNCTVRLEGVDDERMMCLAKYDPAGKLLWARKGSGSPSSAVADPNGGIYVTGKLPIRFGQPYSGVFDGVGVSGPNEGFLVRYDSDGNVLWARNEGGGSLALDNGQALYAGGQLLEQRSFGGKIYQAIGSLDLFVARYDLDGNPVSAWQVADLEQETGGYVAVAPAGHVYLLGSAYHTTSSSNYQVTNYGSWDIFLAKLAAAGPSIVRQPNRIVLFEGSNAVFSVQATNAISPQYQWHKGGIPLAESDRLSGTTNDTLVIRSATLADEGEYSVRIAASNGVVFSALAGLRIEGTMEFTGIGVGTAGEARVSFKGMPGRTYDVEYSTNCIHWMPLTNGFSFQGMLTISDFGAPSSGQRFYRAVAR